MRFFTTLLLTLPLAVVTVPPEFEPSQTGSSTRPLAQVPAVPRPTDLRVLVPAYFYPVPGSPWVRLTAASAAYPGRVAAIGNPASGPGTSVDPTYTAAFQTFRASAGTLIGYVSTRYAARPIAEVKADLDTWLLFYPVDGFFLDEMSNVPGQDEAYHLELNQFIAARLPGALVVGNPGTSTSPSYLFLNTERVVCTLCIYEDSTDFLTWTADPWVDRFAGQNFYALPHSIQPTRWQAIVDHAYSQNCGWIYTTDDTLPNPWDTLPAFFESFVGYVDGTY